MNFHDAKKAAVMAVPLRLAQVFSSPLLLRICVRVKLLELGVSTKNKSA